MIIDPFNIVHQKYFATFVRSSKINNLHCYNGTESVDEIHYEEIIVISP